MRMLIPEQAAYIRGGYLNPTHFQWRSLIADGFPFIKISLLRDNTFGPDLRGWQQTVNDGELVAIILEHLLTAKRFSRTQMCPCGSGSRYKHCHGKYDFGSTIAVARTVHGH